MIGCRKAARHLGCELTSSLLLLVGAASWSSCAASADALFRQRLPEDEVIYFLLPDRFENGDASNDRGGLTGDRLITGYDPTHKGFYHGGDLRGLTARLDYLEALGVSAIWLAPIYKNKAVQGGPGQESAGYHGYWITDFTQVDPHFGTNDEFRALVDAAHARGIKVYLDIITNHTADVIRYRECPESECPYRSRGEYPYSTAGTVAGASINAGFLGDTVQTVENFARLTRPDFAYRPYVPRSEASLKVPAWLNDPIWYHNRGNTTFTGESILFGDFVGLDDLMTENPRVVQGFIDIYGAWIDEYGIDGFRIDTAKHVNPEFWQVFIPAMLERAHKRGIPNFHIFGEVFTDELDVALLARHTKVDRLPTVLDFAFRSAVVQTLAGSAGTTTMKRLFDADVLYAEQSATARQLPTFVSNHDVGRLSQFIRKGWPQAGDDEVMRRVILAHAMMFTTRGVPVIYSGDEQGFVSDGNDQDAREDLFPSRVAVYNDNRLLGTNATTVQANFDRDHPLFVALAELARLRRAHPALRRGEQVVRHFEETPGLFAITRTDASSQQRVLIAFNTSNQDRSAFVEVGYQEREFAALRGACEHKVAAAGSVRVRVPKLDYIICRSVSARK